MYIFRARTAFAWYEANHKIMSLLSVRSGSRAVYVWQERLGFEPMMDFRRRFWRPVHSTAMRLSYMMVLGLRVERR